MNIQIDAKGKQCPLPVIEAKNAISGMTEAGIVEVTVDNEIAVQNLTKMADHKGLKAKSEKKSDQEYTVWMEVTEEFVKNNIKDGNVSSTPVTEENCIPDIRKKKTVVVLGEGIRSQILFATFVKNIETHIKSNAMTKALKQLIHQQIYHL